MLLSALC